MKDWCATAEDVRLAARHVRAFHERMYPLPERPKPFVEPEPEPPPMIETPPPLVPPPDNIHTMQDLIDFVITYFRLERRWRRELKGPGRLKPLVDLRHLLFVLIKVKLPNKSTPEIGRLFGGRDHTTVLHGIRLYHDVVTQLCQAHLDLPLDIFVHSAVQLMQDEAQRRGRRIPRFPEHHP